MNTPSSLAQHFLDINIETFLKYKTLADKTFARLDTAQMHWQPDPETNSQAIQIRHLSGNMISRWTDFLTTDGEKPDRMRDSEFEDSRESKEELMARWEHGWKVFTDTLKGLTPDDLLKTVLIRQEEFTVVEAITRQVAHYGYHIGQIVQLGKAILGEKWESLSIPRGKSEEFNIGSWKGGTEMVKGK